MKYLISLFIAFVSAQSAFAQSYRYRTERKSWYERFVEDYIKLFKGDVLEIILAVLMGAVILLILGLIVYGIYYAVNYWGVSKQEGRGIFLSKSFTPAHTTTTWMNISTGASSSMTVPITTHHPDNYSLSIEVCSEKQVGSISVEKDFYDSLKKGDEVRIEYKLGRLDDRLSLTNIWGKG